MVPITEVLNALQDKEKQEQVRKLFEELEVLKITYGEQLGKLKQAEDQNSSYLSEVELNKQKIIEIEGSTEPGKLPTGIAALEKNRKDAEEIEDDVEVQKIGRLIKEENQKKLDLQNRNNELGILSQKSKENTDNIKMSLLSYFNHKNTIKSKLTELGLDNKFNIDNIDSSSLKKATAPPLLPPQQHNENEQREKRKPSWVLEKEKNKQQKTDSTIQTNDPALHLIKDIEDKKFVKEWWTKKGYAVDVMSDKLEIKHFASQTEIVITDKAASTSSRDDAVLRLMTQQLIDQLKQKGKLETANFKGSGPDAEKLDRLFKELKEKTINQKNEFTIVNPTTNQSSTNAPRF